VLFRSDMPWYYSAADVMLLCSDSEGSPTSVKEALACDVPVVSTDVGDVVQLIEGVDGCAISDPNPESLAAALRKLLHTAARPVVNGRVAMQRYDQSRIAAAVIDVYRQVVRPRRAGQVAAAVR